METKCHWKAMRRTKSVNGWRARAKLLQPRMRAPRCRSVEAMGWQGGPGGSGCGEGGAGKGPGGMGGVGKEGGGPWRRAQRSGSHCRERQTCEVRHDGRGDRGIGHTRI